MLKHFGFGIVFSLICIAAAAVYGLLTGDAAQAAQFAFIALVLGVMEVSLSFDNAVVNAKVLSSMTPVWRQRFLTWGIAIAVIGMRFVFPLLIVMLTARLGMSEVVRMALQDPQEYSRHLHDAHVMINAFGGSFLLLVFLHYFLDGGKDVHWLAPLERRLARAGHVDKLEVLITLGALLGLVGFVVAPAERFTALFAGVLGVAVYLAVKALTSLVEPAQEDALTSPPFLPTNQAAGQALLSAGRAGAASFVYLEVLDASFSLDGVIGAFAISKEVIVIAAGLAIGAVFVRSMTVALAESGSLSQYRFLEHGAHWGIGSLALIMLLSMNRAVEVPELVTGLIGLFFIVAAFVSSLRVR